MNANYERFLEGNASALRKKCGTDAFGRLEPFELAKIMEVEVVFPTTAAVAESVLKKVLGDQKDTWDGGTMILPDGKRLVILNPTRCPKRQRATMMEELSHLHLKHEPSKLMIVGGVTMRTVKKADEKAAYHVGAAALLPARVLRGAATRGYTAEQVAEEHGISMALLQMRENLVGICLKRQCEIMQSQ